MDPPPQGPPPQDPPRQDPPPTDRARRGRPRLDYPRRGHHGLRRWLPSWRQLLTASLLGTAALTATAAWTYAHTVIPRDLNAFATQQNNVYFWADGTELARTGPVNRQEIPLEQVPESVRWAVLSAENASFYSDPGISPKGIGRAVVQLVTGGDTQGGSTITQQYVKNIYLRQDRTFARKLDEIFIAVKLDRRVGKDEILAGYLNTSWFGRGSYGIESAARSYYGKHAAELNASEGAFLTSVLKGAGLYDPAVGPENHRRAVERWSWTLDRMVETGHLSAEERGRYTEFPEPQSPPRLTGLSGQTGYLVELARSYVEGGSDLTAAQLDLGGYQIHTTFEKPRTAALGRAVEQEGRRLDAEHRPADRNARVGAASVASDGRILALYGGPDYLKQGFDNANTSNVPAGSAFTPFVYAAGLDHGVQLRRGSSREPVSPTTPYDGNDGINVMTPEGPYWGRNGRIVTATNDGRRSYGRIALRTAVEQSVNGPLTQLGMDVGLDVVRRTALDLGLLPASLGEAVPAFALGNSKPSAIRMAAAYTTFSDDGRRTDPYSVTRVTRGGVPVKLRLPAAAQALRPDVARQVDEALEGAVTGGTAGAARAAGPQAAAKTGTTPERTAGWFVGYSGGVSTAVVVFRMDPKTMELSSLEGLAGAEPATPDWSYPADIWRTNAASP
ncbi:transglycosylase domain-containing protein [Kitasatospora sp. NPDC101801]|uniref:transglycosylase domain-containing protein n=1 Tax=Kitasatospora sp. NPDC101801 TaxID=3364103 RepID=UPI0037FEC979